MKLAVTAVTLTPDKTVTGYKGDSDGLEECLKELGDKKYWTASGTKAGNVQIGYPEIPGHPGHVFAPGWQYNIERGNGSVDRLDVVGTATRAGDSVQIAAKLSVRTKVH